MRKLAEQFRASRQNPPGGYVMFYRGEAIGWWDGLGDATHFKPGVIAVPEHRNSPCFIADDGRWERLNPKYEPIEK